MAAPSLMNMTIPNLLANSPNPQAQGQAILQAALRQQQPNPGAPAGGAPQGGISGMMNNGLLSKMFPSMFGGAAAGAPTSLAPPGAAPGGPVGPGIDPNTGLPPTGASAAMPNFGGAGPAPTAMTGLW